MWHIRLFDVIDSRIRLSVQELKLSDLQLIMNIDASASRRLSFLNFSLINLFLSDKFSAMLT